MNMEQIIAILLAVICCQIAILSAAPVNERSKKETIISRQPTRFTVVLNDEETEWKLIKAAAAKKSQSQTITTKDNENEVPSSRQKRHADSTQAHGTSSSSSARTERRRRRHATVDSLVRTDETLSHRDRRLRRSAAFFLHASIQLCNNHPKLCSTIEVDAGDLRAKIRISDE